MNYETRVIYNDAGTLSDLTLSLNSFHSSTATLGIVAADDYLYVGSRLPFNHFYFDVSTANDVTAKLKVEAWWSSAWNEVYDLMDATSVTGKTLAQSGAISWSINNFKGWDIWSRGDASTGIQSLNIFDRYWIRLSFNANLKATTALNFIGYKFNSDTDLYVRYPEFNDANLRAAFQTGKTNWNEQTFAAAEDVCKGLQSMLIVKHPNQILNYSKFKNASIHRVAFIIFSALGKSYEKDKLEAAKQYKDAMNLKYFDIDSNNDGNLSQQEGLAPQGYFYR